jgi:ADP-ribose pyrophosphatase YjhB (NUDIX family)
LVRFNLRVYALILNEFDEILLSDECRFGTFFTKFPGGGVETGEGIKDALFRELQEELSSEQLQRVTTLMLTDPIKFHQYF